MIQSQQASRNKAPYFLRWLFCLVILAPLLSHPAAADNENNAEANKRVQDRVHQHLEPSGIAYGNLFFYPSVTATAEYDSNVFASPSFEVDDRIFVLSPRLRILKDGSSSRHQLELGADRYEYEQLDSEDRTAANILLRSGWTVNSLTQFNTAFEAAWRFEPRDDSSTPNQSASPIGYRDLRAETVITKTFNRFGVGLGGSARTLAFDDAETNAGAFLDQSFRDGTIFTVSLRPFYDFSPGYRAFARLSVNRRDYDGVGSLNRDSEGYNATGGVEFTISPLLLGSIEGGYFEQDYANALIPTASGPSILADLSWLMTPLMTVSVFSSRSTAETASFEQNGRVDFVAGARLDYEFRRNLITTFQLTYKNEEFNGTSRKDDILQLQAKIDYAINQYFLFGLEYLYSDRDSNTDNFSFERNRFMVNVKAQY